MKVSLVQFKGLTKDRPELIPELLASVGARFSRDNAGIDSILESVNSLDEQEAINKIFSWIDYGHRSIADTVMVCLALEGISHALCMYIWNNCQLCAGTESSTRYIQNMTDYVSISDDIDAFSKKSLESYTRLTALWEDYYTNNPSESTIPSTVKIGSLKHNRMMRNQVLDRSRVLIPLTFKTNLFLVQSSREWVGLIKKLRSTRLEEFINVADSIENELKLIAPRMIKYGSPDDFSYAIENFKLNFGKRNYNPVYFSIPHFNITDISEFDLLRLNSLSRLRHNRYDDFGQFGHAPVRLRWDAAPIGEIRDIQRHRQGFRSVDYTVRMGTYLGILSREHSLKEEIEIIYKDWLDSVNIEFTLLESLTYCEIFGGCYPFKYHTSLSHAIYMIELRTGTGSHFKYADMFREVYERAPDYVQRLIMLGEGEPE